MFSCLFVSKWGGGGLVCDGMIKEKYGEEKPSRNILYEKNLFSVRERYKENK